MGTGVSKSFNPPPVNKEDVKRILHQHLHEINIVVRRNRQARVNNRLGGDFLRAQLDGYLVRHDYRLGVPDDVPAWHETLNTDIAKYGGSDVTNPDVVVPAGSIAATVPVKVRFGNAVTEKFTF